jgi:hypothetical protein
VEVNELLLLMFLIMEVVQSSCNENGRRVADIAVIKPI